MLADAEAGSIFISSTRSACFGNEGLSMITFSAGLRAPAAFGGNGDAGDATDGDSTLADGVEGRGDGDGDGDGDGIGIGIGIAGVCIECARPSSGGSTAEGAKDTGVRPEE
jgi:hypothetical protein